MSEENIKKSVLDEEIEQIADATKRDFIKKFGSYAASAPLAGYILMTPNASARSNTSNINPGPGRGNHNKKCKIGHFKMGGHISGKMKWGVRS